ncbi:hypothetical protein H6P81_016049 [Aristolochia fimbriata]|uniref:Uncharacterized protein n=1 Tax=Aristolochia fimbriata TaxID=158543 RepID=A0AAV7E7L1_ARIFI|nr:hypothetical protein H6P81_016049 [Aristolochia fimbriata]
MDGFLPDPYPPPSGNSQASMREGGGLPPNLGRRAWAERPPVQILVVVANIQMRTLKVKKRGKGSPETPGGARKSYIFLFNSLPTLETAQPEVGSSGWKSTATPLGVPAGAPGALENWRTKVPPTPGRTHNRIRSPRQGKSAKWIQNSGKGLAEGWARGPSPNPPGCRWTARSCSPRAQSWSSRVGRGRTGNAPLGPSPAPNSRLRTGTDKGN